jgi:hypothetical protein
MNGLLPEEAAFIARMLCAFACFFHASRRGGFLRVCRKYAAPLRAWIMQAFCRPGLGPSEGIFFNAKIFLHQYGAENKLTDIYVHKTNAVPYAPSRERGNQHKKYRISFTAWLKTKVALTVPGNHARAWLTGGSNNFL